MSANLVRLNRVGLRYATDRYALQSISFDLQRGEFAYITGNNGAGKTTLLKLLFAMEKASEGNILVNNKDLSSLAKGKVFQYRREVGFVFQDFKLLPDLTVYDNVSLPLEIRKMTPSEVDYRVRGVLSLVGLADRARDYPLTLSGGEQQRVAIARSIIGKPFLLLADEPTGNLDADTAREIMSLFLEINEMGTTVVIATHDKALMEEFPSRVIELNKGRVIADRRMMDV
ncbi:MAG: cell division ATP-binding protein FtsE [Bdellovibrionales bacterium]|nr:cell division ATP-binding protein FtsE [Pseudomonadota bacterium]MSP18024.1 cell division ATP-binding protein FtsE [Bdellovibrionales bacterium]NQW45960.1 cell division ATP-binding protein FtsE [Deltaproteobacteria bacterium]